MSDAWHLYPSRKAVCGGDAAEAEALANPCDEQGTQAVHPDDHRPVRQVYDSVWEMEVLGSLTCAASSWDDERSRLLLQANSSRKRAENCYIGVPSSSAAALRACMMGLKAASRSPSVGPTDGVSNSLREQRGRTPSDVRLPLASKRRRCRTGPAEMPQKLHAGHLQSEAALSEAGRFRMMSSALYSTIRPSKDHIMAAVSCWSQRNRHRRQEPLNA